MSATVPMPRAVAITYRVLIRQLVSRGRVIALSLIGGAKNFKMEGRKKETFKRGLISAAKSTNALILTGGTNTGTMKLVGDAVREGQFMVQNGDKMSRGIKLLGLCSWGYVTRLGTLLRLRVTDHRLHVAQSNLLGYAKFPSNAAPCVGAGSLLSISPDSVSPDLRSARAAMLYRYSNVTHRR